MLLEVWKICLKNETRVIDQSSVRV